MRHLLIIIIVVIGPVGAFVNNTLHQLAGPAVAPQTATGGGWDNLDDEEGFLADLLNDEQWNYLKCKGQNLLTAMYSSNFDAAKLYNPIRPTAESPWENSNKYTSPYRRGQS